MHRNRLPIVRPCGEDFASMRDVETRGGRTRHCEVCDKSVTDLSTMTEREATAFLSANAHVRPCVRYRTRVDGTLCFRPEPRPARLGFVRAAAAFGMYLAAGTMVGCAAYADPADLEAPTAAETCEDVAGYTIPCSDDEAAAEAVADARLDESDDGPGIAPLEDPPIEVSSAPTEVAPDERMPATGEGCPIPPPTDPGYDGVDDVTMGVPAYDGWDRARMGRYDPDWGSSRRSRRASRRERRRQRRAERGR